MMSAEIGPETNIYPQLATQLMSAIAPAKLNPRVVRANMTYPRESSWIKFDWLGIIGSIEPGLNASGWYASGFI